ncbi:MAG: tyrosine-type recombinase/integrase [Clostridia bacterium]|nr:tyrosine-type recombinase/integrase [Clostridia bacterium]
MATVTKRNGTYRITVSSGYDTSGKQIRRSITWKPEPGMTKKQIEKELERQKVLFEEQVKNGLYIGGNIKLSDFFDLWVKKYAKEHLRPTTLKNYTDCMKRITPALGHIQLNKLQPHHLLSFYENLAEEGIRSDTKYKPLKDIKTYIKKHKITQQKICDKTGLSAATVRSAARGQNISRSSAEKIAAALNIPFNSLFAPAGDNNKLSGATALYYHRVISTMLTTAVYWQIIPYNPCSRVKPPRAEKKEAKYLDEVEAAELLECLENEPLTYKALFTLILYSGMRRGEACGLEWHDIDFKNGIIDINKSSLYLSNRGVFDNDTKTESSHRVIRLPESALLLLKEHKREQATQRLKIGDKWINSGKVFTTWDGKPIHPDTVSGWFHNFVRRHNLPEITVHSLRHTNATLMIANGTDIKTVSKRLGHANITTTGNIYTHAIKTADERAAEALQDLFSNQKAKQA